MIKHSALYRAARALCDAAEPISTQHSTEPDEYVIPLEELEDLQTCILNLCCKEGNGEKETEAAEKNA